MGPVEDLPRRSSTIRAAAQALELVLAVGARLSSEAPFDGGAGELCGKLALLGGARALALHAVDLAHGEAELLGAWGLPVEYVKRFPPRERKPLAQLPGDLRDAVKRVEAVLVPDVDQDARTLSLTSVARQAGLRVALSIPVALDRHVVGLVHAFFAGPPDPTALSVLERTCALVAGAIGRDRLRQSLLVAQSTPSGVGVDESLGLYTRAQIERQLGHTHAAADRYSGHYAVVVYALDHPQRLAYRYGQPLHEQAMGRLAASVNEEARDADQAGRLDESTLVLVMPSTPERGAYSHAERTLQRFGRHVFKHGEERLQLSASAGVSCFPENGALSAEATVSSAHEALRAALGEHGRHIVAIAARGAAAPKS